MSIWELPKEPQFYNWESPITKIYGDIHNEIVRQDKENCTFAIEQAIGYRVDKDELIKALQYDRNQYDKGYNDGVKETFIEELEKIKAEIETKCKVCCLPRIIAECNISKSNREWCEYYYCLKIINEHIAELKGENK